MGRSLGTLRQPVGHQEAPVSPLCARLAEALGHLCASQLFVHEVHGSAPVHQVSHVRFDSVGGERMDG
jgi:hypothetical protein